MYRQLAVLAFVLAAMVCICESSLPAVSSPTYMIEPGEYVMDEDFQWSANGVTSMVGNCTDEPAPCVTINMGVFYFNVSSAPSIPNLLISGIIFTNYTGSAPGAFNISQVLPSLTLDNVVFSNSSSSFISAFPPDDLVLADCAFTDNSAPILIHIFSNPSLTQFQFMTSIEITNLVASNNLILPSPSYNDSLISLQVASVDTVRIIDSNFSANPNILRIGKKQAGGLIVSDGISELVVKDCIFQDHPSITVPASNPDESSSVVPLFWQTTKSTQTVSTPWIFDSNTFVSNNATLVQVVLIDLISISNNIFEDSPDAYAFLGQIQVSANFQSNRFLGSGLLSFTYGQPTDTGVSSSIFFSNDVFDFGGAPSQRFVNVLAPISISSYGTVSFTDVTFENMAPSSSVYSALSIVRLEAVSSIVFDSCIFQNASLATSSTSNATSPSINLTPAQATQTSGVISAELARISINWPLGGPYIAQSSLTLKNTTFGSYASSDLSTADIGVFDNSGMTPELSLVGASTNSLINISRFATTGSVTVQSPLTVTEMIYNPIDSGIAGITLASSLTVNRPVLLYGRIQLNLGSSAHFVFTPSINGSIAASSGSGSTFVPRVIPQASTVLSVDLGSGMSVPLNSTYVLISKASVSLPSVTSVSALKDGSMDSGFSGLLKLTNTSSSSILSYSLTMVATPTCQVACVTGICNARDFCDCDDGWSGTACTCLESGRPSGVSCSASTTEIEWISTSQQTVTDTLQLPAGLSFHVQSDMSITGTIRLAENSLLLVDGTLSVSGGVVMQSLAVSYPHSCDTYLPTMVASNALMATGTSNFEVNIDTKNIPTCGNTKKDALESSLVASSTRLERTWSIRRSLIRDLTGDVSGMYDTILVVNSSIAVDGTVDVDAKNVTVTPGKQRQAKIIGTNDDDPQLSLLTVNVETKPSICSTTSRSGSQVSLFFTVCNGTKHVTKWWWYGAPIIAVGAIVILVIVLTLVVPPWRRAIYPYSAKAKT